jgi:hypothetical protein
MEESDCPAASCGSRTRQTDGRDAIRVGVSPRSVLPGDLVDALVHCEKLELRRRRQVPAGQTQHSVGVQQLVEARRKLVNEKTRQGNAIRDAAVMCQGHGRVHGDEDVHCHRR